MSLLVKGMEMPKCDECFWCIGHRIKCPAGSKDVLLGGRHPCCPLVHVQPHGKLGDLDALKETIEDLIEKHLHGYTKSTWDFVCELRSIISDAPTIIPADPAEEVKPT